MARQNRKRRAAGFIVPPLPLAAILAAGAGVCLFYLGLTAKTEALGREIKSLETRRESLRRVLMKEQAEWSRLELPTSIDLALKAHGIDMTWPTRDQIVRLHMEGGAVAAFPSPRPVRPPASKVAMND